MRDDVPVTCGGGKRYRMRPVLTPPLYGANLNLLFQYDQEGKGESEPLKWYEETVTLIAADSDSNHENARRDDGKY